MSRGAIEHRQKTGRLQAIHSGVYAFGHRCLTRSGHWMAGVLSGGPGAALSHASAAALWDLRSSASALVDVTIEVPWRPGPKGVRLHCVRGLDERDLTVRDGIPVTSMARTLLDLAEVVPLRQLERAVEEAERLRVFDRMAVEEACARIRGRHGIRPLRAVIGGFEPISQVTRSELERRFLKHCINAGISRPQVNTQVAGYEVDMCWPEEQLIVELDGHEFHGSRRAFEADRIRDADLQLAGYRVIRITHRRLEMEPEAAMQRVRGLLETQPS